MNNDIVEARIEHYRNRRESHKMGYIAPGVALIAMGAATLGFVETGEAFTDFALNGLSVLGIATGAVAVGLGCREMGFDTGVIAGLQFQQPERPAQSSE